MEKCEEMKSCKFIMATTKIKDILKAIVNSEELYALFNMVAVNFDYSAAKQKCFVCEGGEYGRFRLILPNSVGDRLAFIFCLMVEFDRNDINFNAFLQQYYPKDGSFYASYHSFCDEVIDSLIGIISDIFYKELHEEDPALQLPQASAPEAPALLPDNPTLTESKNAVLLLLRSESDAVVASALSDEDKEAAEEMLSALTYAVEQGDVNLVKALTCGYNYFALYSKYDSETLSMLFEEIGALVEAL